MNSKWDEEFDFMDQGDKKENKKKDPKKGNKMTNGSNDFDDLEDDGNGLKLPIIGGKNTNKSLEKSKKKSNQMQLEELSVKKENNKSKASLNPYEQPEEIFEESVGPTNSPHKEQNYKEKFAEPSYLPPESKAEDEQYGEENFEAEEKYQEDFERQEEKKVSPIISKGKEKKIIQPKGNLNAPKPPSRTRKGVESVSKNNDTSARIYSRNSARSYDRTQRSKTRVEDRKDEGPNKFANLAEKQCPNYDQKTLEEFSLDKLTRQNERIRNAIKKLNDELNDMINKNINQLKTKKVQKEVNQQDVIKNLQEQKNSNQVVLQTSNRELSKLKNKQGTLKEEEYHLSLDEKIIEAKNSIAECGKIIPKLKLEVDLEGKRLTKIDKSDKEQTTVEISNIKISTINTQKEFQKNQETLSKMESKFDELAKKVNQIESKHSKEMEEAKEKGISIITNPQLMKKVEQLRKKVDIGKNHKGKTEALYKTKSDMVVHELEQIKAQIKQFQQSTLTLHANCEQVQEQSKKVVEKASKGSKISQQLLVTLESILLQMERGGIIVSKENFDDQATLTYPKGAKKKYHSVKNVDKVPVTPPPPRQQQRSKDDTNLKKPQLFKKKKEQQKQDERVWKDQSVESPKKSEKGKQSQPDLTKFEDRQEKNQQKKKPFMIKKKDRSNQQKIESPKEEKKEVKGQQSKNEETPSIAPRMKIFKRNKEEPPAKQQPRGSDSNDKNYISKKQETNNLTLEEKDEEKPSFVPRRFNLKMKDKKNQDNGYVASAVTEKKQQPKIEETTPKEEYKPKRFNIEKTQSNNIQVPQAINQIKIEAEEEKPKFNLKLRDRDKEINRQQKIEEKIEITKQMEPPQPKITVNLNDNPKPSKQNNNPYAQVQTQEGPKREREGRVKKQKPAQNLPKQQFNIYEQAEDLTNIKSLEPSEPKPNYAKPEVKEEDLDLNKMLGINKNKNEGFADLLGDSKPVKGAKKEKKDANFFGDLQL